MAQASLAVYQEDLKIIEQVIKDDCLPEDVVEFLVSSRGAGVGPQISFFRLTRLLKLYVVVRECAGISRYEQVFEDFAEEWLGCQKSLKTRLPNAVLALTEANRLWKSSVEGEYESSIGDRREQFREEIKGVFNDLCVILAAVVVSMNLPASEVGKFLRGKGFRIEDEQEQPAFPLASLTGFIIVLSIAVIGGDFTVRQIITLDPPQDLRTPLPNQMIGLMLALSHAITIFVTLYVLSQFSGNIRVPAQPRWHIYCTCFFAAGLVHFMGWTLLFRLTNGGFPIGCEWGFAVVGSAIIATFCFAVAFLCDFDVTLLKIPLPRRLLEGFASSAFVAMGVILVKIVAPPATIASCSKLLSPPQQPVLLLFPLIVAFLIGTIVPHLVRAERQFALHHA